MEEKDPCQRVLSISELVDHIFRFMSLKTVIACRQVNRQWLEVSELYLKRRVCVDSAEHLTDGKQRQKPWTAAVTFSENPQGEELNVMDIEDVVYEIGPRLVVFALAKGAPATPLMKLVLQMEWMPAITTLELFQVFTFEEWILFRHQLLEKLDHLTSVDVAFRPGESRISLPEEKTAQYLNVQRVEFNFAYIKAEGAHRMERVVKDVFQMFPRLVTLKAWHFHVVTWLTRSNDERDVNAKVNEKWEFGFEVLKDPFNLTDAIWTHVATVFVKIAQLRKIYTNSADKVLSLLTTDDSYASQLEALTLTSFCHHHENDATPLLLTSTKFNNLKHLQWVYFPDQFCGSEVPVSVESVVGNYGLPNLEMVHLQRNYCQAIGQHEGLRLEKWILENLQKMAPNVKRLVASVFSPLVNGFPGGDWLKVLRIARSFVHLEQMFFINHQSPGSSQWTDLNMEEVVPCLGGLKSISLLVKDPAVLTGSAQFFVRAAARVRTIETLNLYRYGSGQEEEAAIFDLNLVEVAVPDHLLVSSGRWTKEVAEALEVVEDEVDH